MMLFPIEDLLDEERCDALLRDALHPDGLRCPNGHALPPAQAPHTRTRAPRVASRCRACTRVFHLLTDTALSGVRHACSRIVMMLRGFRQAFRSTRNALEPRVVQARPPGATIMSDAWHASDELPATGRAHATVHHRSGEYARDDDGDGIREVHNHTMEGFWLGLRNFLR